ncbi:phage minor capsid protein [Arthrobacter sp. N1]|uniref:phage minor capsid protein n=1 Tax=Arthrobacter sp. N1 TaxID=619291 RepID=UPI003BAF4285
MLRVIRPEEAAEKAKSVRELFVTAEAIMLARIAKALAEGRDEPDWANRKLNQLRTVMAGVDDTLAKVENDTPILVDQALYGAYLRGIATGGLQLKDVGLSAGALDGPQNTRAVVALVAETMGRLNPMIRLISRTVRDVYQQTITETAAQVLTGAQTRRDASRDVLVKLTERGVTGFKDASDRNWEMASYAEMAVRTTATKAALQGQSDRLTELGLDLVIVSNAPEECNICRPFEGKVLTLMGSSGGEVLRDGVTVYASLAEAQTRGLYHPNCRHSHTVYLPGITKAMTDTEDPEGDALRQQQRAFERRIRELKRRDAIDKEFGGPKAAETRGKLRAKQAEFADWREANGRKNLAYRMSIKNR